MADEKYNLVCRGEIVDGFDKTLMINQLVKIFKTDEESISKIFTPKLKILVKNLSWDIANKYQAKLKSIGLIVYLDLALSAEIFREGLVRLPGKLSRTSAVLNTEQNPNVKLDQGLDKKSKETEKYKELLLLKFNRTKLIPTMLHPACSESLADDKESTTFILQSYNFSINSVFILIVSLFAALLIQKYFTMVMVVNLTGPIVTIISILLFFTVIFFLPKIMSPNRAFTLRLEKNNEPYLLCRQLPGFNLFVSHYEIYTAENSLVAYITYNKIKSQYECIDDEGSILFTSSEEHDIDDFTKGVTEDLRDELFDLHFMKYIQSISNLFKKIDSWINKKPQSYRQEDGFIIRDGNSKKVATYYREKMSAIELPKECDNQEKLKILTAFALICVGID